MQIKVEFEMDGVSRSIIVVCLNNETILDVMELARATFEELMNKTGCLIEEVKITRC